MSRIGYKISARATILLGREGVSKADGAIVELIKNTYDADADLCLLCIDKRNDSIYLFDNGTGMSSEIIENCWMVIGTANKQENYRSSRKRIKSGEKGIGRFALDRLGSSCVMYTKSDASSAVLRWKANWGDFEDASKTLDQMGADLDEITSSYESIVPSFLKNAISKAIDEIYNESGKQIEAYQSGTLFIINGLRDDWDSPSVSKLISGLGTLLPPTEQSDFFLCTMKTAEDEYELVENPFAEEYDYKIHALFDGERFEVSWNRNEFDLERIPTAVFEREEFQAYPYRREDFELQKFTQVFSITQLLKTSDEGLINKVRSLGSFSFDYVFMKRTATDDSSETFYYKEIGKNRKEWLDEYGGIKIYRDNFFVRPYGDPSADAFDWLGLDARKAKNPQSISHENEGWHVTNRQSQGTVSISRLTNSVLLDKSSREGIIENEYFVVFKNVLVAILSVFEKDRAYIGKAMRRYSDEVNEKEKTKEEGKNIANSVLNSIRKDKIKKAETNEVKLAKAVKVLEEEKEDLLSEIQTLKVLATSGLISSTVAHDLKSINAILVTRVSNLKRVILQNDSEKVNRHLDDLRMNDEFLKSWLTIVATQARKDRRTRKKENVYQTIRNLINVLTPILDRKKVNVTIGDDGQIIERRIFVSDFESVFYNLIINSIEAFQRVSLQNRNVTISMYSDDKSIVIDYSDNGPGISDLFKNPYDIFAYGTTSKKDKDGNDIGTGMGMYIVASTLREYSAEYKIVEKENGFGLNIKIPR